VWTIEAASVRLLVEEELVKCPMTCSVLFVQQWLSLLSKRISAEEPKNEKEQTLKNLADG
jgi:hypothetical protein